MKLILLGIIIFSANFVSAQKQFALLIGINKYDPPGHVSEEVKQRIKNHDLKGPVNDVALIKSIIETKYFFPANNISTLLNEKASRQNIISSFNSLLAKCNKGDIAFIYYAGHGSEVPNSRSREDDQIDESMVPADAWKPGVKDIRDKELAVIFNKFIDKGVILTCIFDCCHSGSIQRGYQSFPPVKRYIPAADYDANDPSNPPAPEKKPNSNFLILSACQDRESAIELYDSTGEYGVFTHSLVQALYQQNTDAPVYTLFSAASAIVATRIAQSPVLAGDTKRMKGTLFGIGKGILPNKNLVSVIVDTLKRVIVQGGFLMGLNVENELTSVNSKVKIKVVQVLSPTTSQAEIIQGELHELDSTGLFEVTNWVSPSSPLLKIFIPSSSLSESEISAYSGVVQKVNNLVTDFGKNLPELSVFYSNNKWWCNHPSNGTTEINEFSLAALNALANGKKININIPPSSTMSGVLKQKYAELRNVQLVSNAEEAQYVVYGTPSSNSVAYSLLRMHVSAADSLGMMPVQTLSFKLNGTTPDDYSYVADSLYEYSIRLAKVKGWITIQPPKSASFPVHLELRDKKGKRLDTIGLKINQGYDIYLVLDDEFEAAYKGDTKHIYAFGIDKDGKMTLLYPEPDAGRMDNKFPVREEKGDLRKVNLLSEGWKAIEPVGTDNYFLLITDVPIDNYSLSMNQPGVRGKGSGGALDQLLNFGNETKTRSRNAPMPANWSLQRMAVTTRH